MGGLWEIRLAGSGGQGLLLAGLMLAEAAALFDDKNVVQSQSYGPEARGGTSQAELIVSDDEIDYPRVVSPNVLLVLTQESADKYGVGVAREGIVIADRDAVERVPGHAKVYALPITATAKQTTGTPMTASVVGLGVVVGLTSVVSDESLRSSVRERSPRGTEAKNAMAVDAGLRLARSLSAAG